MAWYAELKRLNWYCINGVNMIQFYKKKLYDDWYNSLTEEQKQQLEEYRKTKAEKKQKEAREALQRLFMVSGMVSGIYNRNKYFKGQ